ncbi:S8 family serine peptidase [Piscinibacter gummiphilus]|uniref:S8 family serine peptidase n=1 Tax=Piscinibacter gummiphilus TaxID=946333 RepID=A0ABZ0CYI4_9BURK|nr:S8 family serine peptidase [Piscinibacter gummiphilus]WOB10009.1 S8 family serine peptidase [Piscinibacter gummiphilus]
MSLSSRVARLAAAAFAATLVAACGGGGDDGGGSPPPPPPAGTFQVSGQIRVADNTLVDSDVNDENAPYTANDSFATAQALPNPVSLAGYVNEAGQGASGRSRAAGDRSDFFRVDAVAGQTVSLVVGDPQAGDIDLYLYDENQNEIEVSEDTGRFEALTIPATGRYYVEAYAYQGAGNYVLAVGQEAVHGQGGGLLRSADFVPGEVIVRWRQPAQVERAGKRSAASPLSVHALSKVAGPTEGAWLAKLDSPRSHLLQSRSGGRVSALAADRNAALSHAELKAATLQAIKQLRADPAVLSAEPNYIQRAYATPADQYYRLQWHYPLINLPAAWDITTGSNSVIVAVIDTGVLTGHPDLAGQLVPGYDFITDPARANDGNGPDNDPNDPGDNTTPGGSSSFHGTHVAGTVAASSNTTRGVAGVAWNARIMPLRALGVNGGTSFDILQAVLYAAGLPNGSGTLPARRADIINLSLGGGAPTQAAQEVYTQARAAGVIIVAAAGNESTSQLSYPASYDGVISVSAVSIRKTLASYSNYGSRIDVAAPGGDSGDVNGDGYEDAVASTIGDDRSGTIAYSYGLLSGTSMAAPHVAGVLALMKSVNPALTPDDIDRLLVAGRLTTELGPGGRDDQFGHGLIDALKAVQAAQNGTAPTPALLVATPGTLNFAPGITAQTLVLTNNGTEALNVTAVNVTPASPWLTVTPPAAANGLGTYTVTVNRTGLTPGAYNASLQFVSNANTVSMPVVLQVTAGGGASPRPNLGELYVQLVNPDTLAGVAQVRVRATNGVYNYQFTNVAAGTYYVLAGSDPNNDDRICDVGEACGAYLTLDDPVRVTISGSRGGLDFSAGFVTSIGAAGQDRWNPLARNASTTGLPRMKAPAL